MGVKNMQACMGGYQ